LKNAKCKAKKARSIGYGACPAELAEAETGEAFVILPAPSLSGSVAKDLLSAKYEGQKKIDDCRIENE
jgi:hypothetical protein